MGGPVGGTRTGGVGGPGGIGGGGGGIGGVGTDPGIGSIGGVSGGPDGDIGSAGGMGGMPPTRTGRQTAPSTITPPVVVTGDVPQKTAEGGETVSQAPKPTGVPGVLLVTDPASGVAGTLIEYGKNIHLDSGTVMTLGGNCTVGDFLAGSLYSKLLHANSADQTVREQSTEELSAGPCL